MNRLQNLTEKSITKESAAEPKSKESLAEAVRKIQNQDSGEIPYGLTNDYMFRAVFQKNEKALRGLLCAFLNLEPEEITSCEVTNPIILGENLDEKTCILDLRIRLNNNQNINLEMQVGNLANWPKRSTYYLCSMYTDLKKGVNYLETVPCVHIGIVTESPFKDRHKFISQYQLADLEDGHIYCSDLSLIMLDLSQIDELENTGTEYEKTVHKVSRWAKLFCAKSWEEAIKVAEGSEAMQETIVTMRELSEDEKVRQQCLGRILYDGDMESARQVGKKIGQQIGEDRINTLMRKLVAEGRQEDLIKSLNDRDFQKKLLEEFGL